MLELGRRKLLLAGAGLLVPRARGPTMIAATADSPAAVRDTGWGRKFDWRFGTAGGNNIRQFTDWLEAGWYMNPSQTFLNDECETYNARDVTNHNANFQAFADHADIVALWNGGPIASGKGNGSLSSLQLNWDAPFSTAVGYYELTCKIPSVSGGWPAWWTVGHTPGSERAATWGPEIDIFEFYDTKTGTCISSLHGSQTPSYCFMRQGGNPPASPDTPYTAYDGKEPWDMGHFVYTPGIDFAQDYHRFGVKIASNRQITLWIDDVRIGTFAADQYCDDAGHPVAVHLTVNLALGTRNPNPVASIHTQDFGGANNRSAANKFRLSLKNIQIWAP